MRELDPQIELHQLLGRQIYNALQGPVTDAICRKCVSTSFDVNYRSVMEGNSLKVSPSLLPQFYALCKEVKSRLEFEADIDFYITGDSSANACSYASSDDERPHIIQINSGLFNLMNDEELRYVVGHEIGHLINSDAAIVRLFNFIYAPDEAEERCPDFLLKRFKLFKQLAELSADRYGYMANENLEACVTAIFKTASGLFLDRMNVSVASLMAENSERLEFFLNGSGVSVESHPVNPIRIKALELFATAKTQAALTRGMNELVAVLQSFTYGELDVAFSDFIAAAGLVVAHEDDKFDRVEQEFILQKLGSFCLFPHKELKRVEKGDAVQILCDAANKILNLAPQMRAALMRYFIDVAFADNELTESELKIINYVGGLLHYSEEEVAQALGQKIREDFVPLAAGLKV